MADVTYGPITRGLVADLSALTVRTAEHDDIPIGMTEDDFLELFDDPHTDVEQDTRVALIGNTIVGWCRVWYEPADERLERSFVFGQVAPEHRRRGIGTTLLTWGDERAEQQLVARTNNLPKYVRADAAPTEHDKRKILEGLGMSVVRYFDNMTRPFTDPIPDVVADGFEIVPFDTSRSEAVRQVCIEAFRDHWGSAGVTRDGWESWLSSKATRLDLSRTAVIDDTIVGYSINAHHKADNAVHGRHEAWVDSLGTLQEHRGRGIASALLVASMHAMEEAGFESVGLDVDSANPTGAHGLYRRLGFVTTFRSTMYERQVG